MTKIRSAEAGGDWHECSGEVGHLVHQLKWRRQAGRIRRGALIATLCLVTVCGNYFYSDVSTALSVEATGSPCDHYSQELRAFYCDKSLNELDPSFWVHLAKCQDCQRDFRLFGGIAHHHMAHLSRHDKRADAATATHHISLNEVLARTTLAAGH